MEKFIAFGKLYLSEILFAVVSVLTLALAACSALCLKGFWAVGGIIFAVVLQVVLGRLVRKYASKTSFLQMNYTVWLFYIFAFMLLMLGCYFSFFRTGVEKSEPLFALCIVLAAIMLRIHCVESIKKQTLQSPIFMSVNKNSRTDIVPEPAEKLPYVYYDKPVEQTAYTIRYYSPYLGKVREIQFRPRKIRGKSFDNVRGIVVADNLILLRSILFTANFPDDIREIAKQHEGRLPNKDEIEQIYAKFDEINQNLYECGEPLLKRGKYLYTSGDENADKAMNYCLNFATGQESLADCDSFVCAVLVEKSIPGVQQLEADIKTFKKKHLNKTKLGDEFDLLNGQKVRLPFSKRHLGKPIGIFPFAGPEYLELEEQENKKHTDKDVDESRLLDERFCCGCVSTVVDRLNLYLEEMNKPLLEGSYLADSSYMRGCGWIIGFDNTSDYYGGNVPAKLRYMGRFYGKCQK